VAVFAGPLTGYLEGAANQLFDPSGYIDAVLSRASEG
jgi:multicomponent K+:H+ antiporter subunit D